MLFSFSNKENGKLVLVDCLMQLIICILKGFLDFNGYVPAYFVELLLLCLNNPDKIKIILNFRCTEETMSVCFQKHNEVLFSKCHNVK